MSAIGRWEADTAADPVWATAFPDAGIAVQAHELLGSVSVIGWGVELLAQKAGTDLPAMEGVVDVVKAQLGLITDLLGELARGLPFGAGNRPGDGTGLTVVDAG